MEAFNEALKITAIGMGGIFAFMLVFYLAIRFLDHFFPGNTTTTGHKR